MKGYLQLLFCIFVFQANSQELPSESFKNQENAFLSLKSSFLTSESSSNSQFHPWLPARSLLTCYSGCASCTTSYFDGCTSCTTNYILFEGMCVLSCPTGWSSSSGTCVQDHQKIFDFTFDKIQGYFDFPYDDLSLVCGSSAIKFYPYYDDNDPYPTKTQGYYFDPEKSNMQMPPNSWSKDDFILGYKHTINLWVWRRGESFIVDYLLYKENRDGDNPLFYVTISPSTLVYSFMINGIDTDTYVDDWVTLTFEISDPRAKWNAYAIVSDYSADDYTITLYENNSPVSQSWNNQGWSRPWHIETNFIFGFVNSNFLGLNGWLGEFAMYSSAFSASDINNLYETSCSDCTFCPSSIGYCFLDCDFSNYFNGDVCEACEGSCTSPCVYSNRCDLCFESCGGSSAYCSGFDESDCLYHTCNYCWQCSGKELYQCFTCDIDRYLLRGICVVACPGRSQEQPESGGGECNASFGYDFELTKTLSDGFLDLGENYYLNPSDYYRVNEVYDPIPSYKRGYYFNGVSSYLYTDWSPLRFDIDQTHSFWIKTQSNSIQTLLQKLNDDGVNINLQMQLVDLNIKLKIRLSTQNADDVFQVDIDSITVTQDTWGLFYVIIRFIRGYTYWKICADNTCTDFVKIGTGYYYDTINIAYYGINKVDSSDYFQGFIWEIMYDPTIWSFNQITYYYNNAKSCTSDGGCNLCLYNDQCLADCDWNYYYDETAQSCQPCSMSCKFGCRNGQGCDLCDITACEVCETFTSTTCMQCYIEATPSSSYTSCDCPSGKQWDSLANTCVKNCYYTCSECTTAAMNQCIMCNSEYNYYNNFCVENCPIGYYIEYNYCMLDNQGSLVINFDFTKIDNVQYDSVSNYSMYMGTTDSYYPNYDINDPWVLPYRGLYFQSDSVAIIKAPDTSQSSHVSLGLNHTIDIWTMVNASTSSSGVIFGLYDPDNIYIMNLTAANYNSSHFSYKAKYSLQNLDGSNSGSFLVESSYYAYSAWQRVIVAYSYDSGGSTLKMFINSQLDGSSTSASKCFNDKYNYTVSLGSTSLSFVGYIYSLKLYNYAKTSVDSWTSSCGYPYCTENSDKLIICQPFEYYNETSSDCKICDNSCEFGCRRAGNICNLNEDPLCDSYGDLSDSGCITCKGNSTSGPPCACNSKFTYDSTIENCICKWVYDYPSCDCPSGTQWDSQTNTCLNLCYFTCSGCKAAVMDQCTSCNSDYLFYNNFCVQNCPIGYYIEQNSCIVDNQGSLVINFEFTKINNTQYDSVSDYSIYMGTTDSYYPNYDINDPWVLPYRGLFFKSDSIAVIEALDISQSSQISLGLNHTIDIWIMVNASTSSIGIIFGIYDSDNIYIMSLTAENYNSSHFSYKANYILQNLDGSNSGSLLVESSYYTYSVWQRVIVAYSYVNGGSTLKIFINSQLDGSSTSASKCFNDNYNYTVSLGSTSSSFVGYIYSLKLYNYAKTSVDSWISSCGYPYCTENNDKLIICQPFEYYNETSNDCKICDNSCEFGCRRAGNICNLNEDPLCDSYGDLSDSGCITCKGNSTSGPPCACNSKFTYDSTIENCICEWVYDYPSCDCPSGTQWDSQTNTCIIPCYFTCSECTASVIDQCTSCNSDYLFYNNFCVKNCPIGYYIEQNSCIVDNQGLIINFEFMKSDNKQYDSVSNYSIYMGTTDEYYPNYDTNDPWVLPYRGLYFQSDSIAIIKAPDISQSSQVSLGLNHTIDIWTMIDDSISSIGIIFGLYDSDNTYVMSLTAENYNSSHFSYKATYKIQYLNGTSSGFLVIQSSNYAYSVWQRITVAYSYANGETSLKMFINTLLDGSSTITGYCFNDDYAYTVSLGSTSLSFVGYIYSLKLYNYAKTSVDSWTSSCGYPYCTENNDKLIICKANEYYNETSNDCKICDNSCEFGCIRAGNICNLNEDSLCDSYGDLSYLGCIMCKENSTSGPPCECNSRFTYDSATETCICNWVYQYPSCDCPSGTQWDSQTNSCINPCYFTCSNCTASVMDQCTSCISDYLFYNNFCVQNCPIGYYIEQNSCIVDNQGLIINFEFMKSDNKQYDSVSNYSIYMGTTDEYYPNYDTNDPWVLPYRGLYFQNDSIAVIEAPDISKSSQVSLGLNHTIDIWTMIDGNTSSSGVIFGFYDSDNIYIMSLTAENYNSSHFSFKANYILQNLDGSNSGSLLVESSYYTYSVWQRVIVAYSYVNGGSTLKIFINTLLDGSSTSASKCFNDNYNYTVSLGSTSSSFFGYIYSLKLYNYAKTSVDSWTSSCGYPYCTENNDKLIICQPFEYYNETSNDCKICDNSCEFGCRRAGNICNLNEDPLCDSYRDLSDSGCITCKGNSTSGPPCACNSKFTYDSATEFCICEWVYDYPSCDCPSGTQWDSQTNTCIIPCYFTCNECTASAMDQCTSCNSDYLFYNNFCVKNCPIGYYIEQNSCIVDNQGLIINFEFTKIDNIQYDSVSDYLIYMGTTDEYYPNYDINDPWVLPYRGLYFQNDSIAVFEAPDISQSSQISLGLNHTIDIWTMIDGNTSSSGVIFGLYDSGNIYTMSLTAENYNSSHFSYKATYKIQYLNGTSSGFLVIQSSSYAYSVWQRITVAYSYTNGGISLKMFINTILDGSSTITGYCFNDDYAYTVSLGSTSSSFIGYIYSLKLYNYAKTSVDSWTSSCGYPSCTENNDKLIICKVNEYYNETSNDCKICDNSCEFGCIRAGNICNLNEDSLCDSYGDLSYLGCIMCKENSTSGPPCACNSKFKYDSETESCICEWVYNYPSCDCPSGTQWDSQTNTCFIPCYFTCSECTASAIDHCTSCNSDYLFYNNFCVKNCPIGYYIEQNSCIVDNQGLVINFKFTKIDNKQYDSVSNYSIYMGTADEYYPNYDINDPWVLPYRGLYFQNGSIAVIEAPDISQSSQVSLGLNHTIDIWTMIDGNTSSSGVIFGLYDSDNIYIMSLTAENYNSSHFSYKVTYILQYLNGTTSGSLVVQSSNYAYSVWQRVIVAYSYANGESTLKMFINSQLDGSSTSTSECFNDNYDYTVSLGSTSSSFIGYIYSLKLYNYAKTSVDSWTSSCGYPYCTENNDKLIICKANEYYDESSKTCKSCDNSCTVGCIREGNICNLNEDSLCNSYGDLSYSECTQCKANSTSGPPCACNSKFAYDSATESCICNWVYDYPSCDCPSGTQWDSQTNTCFIPCYFTCSECTASAMDHCTSCNSGYLFYNNFCVENCPIGYYIEQNSCVIDNQSLVINFEFTKIDNMQYDSVSNYSIYMGTTDEYYPNYDINDPWVFPYRGLDFQNDSIAIIKTPDIFQSSQVSLGLNHTIDIWTMIDSNTNSSGVIFGIYDSDDIYVMSLTAENYNSSHFSYKVTYILQNLDGTTSGSLLIQSSYYTYSIWQRVIVAYSYANGGSTLKMFINDQEERSSTSAGSCFNDNYNYTVSLGSNGSSFVGYIYSLKLYNYAKQSVDSWTSSCGYPYCTENNDKLIICQPFEYYDETSMTCEICHDSCEFGCIRAGNICNLNEDPLCDTYTGLKPSECTQCKVNSTSTPPCECNSGFIYDITIETCICRTDYQYINDLCIGCNRYLQPSEISGYFTSTFARVVVDLAIPVNTTNLTCEKVFTSDTIEKFGSGYVCSFDSQAKKITIDLGDNFTLTDELIKFMDQALVGMDPSCGYFPYDLNTTLAYTASLQYPVAKIDAPSTVLYNCQDLTISGKKSTGSMKSSLYYKWLVTSEPSLSLSKYNTDFQQTISEFTIQNSELSTATITVTLAVKNKFNNENTVSVTINSIPDGFAINFDKTIDYQSAAPDWKTYGMGSISSCNTYNNLSLKWKLANVNGNVSTVNEDAIWGNQTKVSTLNIPSKVLWPYTSATFSLEASDSTLNLEGSGSFEVSIIPNPPIIEFSRTNGSADISSSLFINANSSYDPNVDKGLFYEWTCTQGNSGCSSFISNTNSENLTISENTLQSGKEYEFKLSALADFSSRRMLRDDRFLADTSSQAKEVITVSTVDYAIPTVNIINPLSQSQPTIITANTMIVFQATIDGGSESQYTYQWSVDNTASIAFSTPLSQLSIAIVEGTLETHQSYTLTLTVSENSKYSYFTYQFYVNSPPYSGNFIVTPTSGIELETVFKMEALEWVDDENNLPLSYSFGYFSGNSEIYLNFKNQSLTYFSTFPYLGDTLKVFVDIYDNLGAYSTKNTNIEISVNKNLNQEELYNNYTDYMNSIASNPQAYPGLISALCDSILNRDYWLNGQFKVPSSSNLPFYEEIIESALGWTEDIINTSQIDSQSISIFSALLSSIVMNPYLNSSSTEKKVCDMIISIFNKIPIDQMLEKEQPFKYFIVTSEAFLYNSSSIVAEKEDLENAIEALSSIEKLVLSQMVLNEVRNVTVNNFGITMAVVPLSAVDGYKFASSNGKASITFPDDFSSAISSITDEKVVNLALSVLDCPNNPNNLSSSVVDFTMYGHSSNQKISVNLTDSNILVQIPVWNVKYSNYTPECVFLDTKTMNWSTEGCTKYKINSYDIICSCNHFTTFTAVNAASSSLVDSNIGDTVNAAAWGKINSSNAIGLYFCIITLTVYGILAVLAYKKDRREEKELEESRKKLLGDPKKLEKVTTKLTNAEYVDEPIVYGKRQKKCWPCKNKNKEIDYDETDKSFKAPEAVFVYSFTDQENSEDSTEEDSKYNKIKKWAQFTIEKHELLNIMFAREPERPSFSRITLFFFALLGQMFFIGMFYQDAHSSNDEIVANNSTNTSESSSNSTSSSDSSSSESFVSYSWSDFWIMAWSSIFMIIITMILNKFLREKLLDNKMTEIQYRAVRKQNKTKRWIGIILAWGIMFYFCWSIALFAIQFKQSISKIWVLNTGISYSVDIFVTSVIKKSVIAFITIKLMDWFEKYKVRKYREKNELDSDDDTEETPSNALERKTIK